MDNLYSIWLLAIKNPIFQGVIAGLIGSMITFSTFKTYTLLKDYFYSKKYYFGGSWNTVYEDNEGLLRIKRYAPAKIFQKGRKISGYTIFGENEDARKWKLDGSIVSDRFLVGTYSIESIHGEYSIGSFFLERNPTGQELFGYWCGYDPVIGDVNSGKYSFYRKYSSMIQVNIRPALKADFERIKSLGDSIFGQGYLDNLRLPDPDKKTFDDSICFVATKESQIIGTIYFLISNSFDPLEKFKDSGFDVSSLLYNTNTSQSNNNLVTSAFLSLIMVEEKYRRQGVGISLYAKVFQILSEVGVEKVYATCWKESPNSAIIPFLKKQGWTYISQKERYWYQDSLDNNYLCARCGNPCFCTAVLMKLDASGGIKKPTPEPG